MKPGKKKKVGIAIAVSVMAVVTAAGGIRYGMLAFRNEQESKNAVQADGPGFGWGDRFRGDGSFGGDGINFDIGSTFFEEGVTQISTVNLTADFLVNGVNLTVEEVYVEAGNTVAEGDALYKLTEESINEWKAYYADSIKEATEELAQVQIEYDSGILEAEYTLQTSTTKGETAQSGFDAALAELEANVKEKQETYETAIETIQAEQAKLNEGTFEKEAAIEAKRKAVDSATKAATEATQAFNNAQSRYDVANSAMEESMSALKRQTEANADKATLLALTNQVVADYEEVQAASGALAETKATSAKAQGDLEKAQMTLTSAQESCQRKTEEVKKKIEELTKSLETLRENIETAEREAVTKKVELKQEYETAVLEGQYAQATYEATVAELKNALNDAKKSLEKRKTEQENMLTMEDGMVRATQAGILSAVNYEAEDVLRESRPLVSYYDTDTILISVEVPQENIADVAVGDVTMVTIDGAMGGVTGTVASIATTKTAGGSISNVTYAVVISIDNTEGMLSSGSSAVVLFGLGDFSAMRDMSRNMPGNLPDGEGIKGEENLSDGDGIKEEEKARASEENRNGEKETFGKQGGKSSGKEED